MFVTRLFGKLDRLIGLFEEFVDGQKNVERILLAMSQAEIDLGTKLDALFAQNDNVIAALGTVKSELDAAIANGSSSDPAVLSAISAKVDTEIAKNVAALAALNPAPVPPPVTAPPVVSDPPVATGDSGSGDGAASATDPSSGS